MLPRPCLVHGLVHTREPQRLRPKDHNRLCLGDQHRFRSRTKIGLGFGTIISLAGGPKLVITGDQKWL